MIESSSIYHDFYAYHGHCGIENKYTNYFAEATNVNTVAHNIY